MPSDPIITVEGLGKRYRLGAQSGERYTALRDVIANSISAPFRRLRNGRQRDNGQTGRQDQSPVVSDQLSGSPSSVVSSQLSSSPRSEGGQRTDEFWALRDINFEVRQGEVLGIIGRNGAGKSTLLKILSRITEPTEGRVRIKGRVASLLEVGTGFHTELTGKENIFLNGAILGMHRHEIKAKFDEIVAFAEVEKFLDTPVKRYSSGMYVRLAFAVAAHLEPEILIVDEVLAVGDTEFQKKCLGKMDEVAHGGRTVLFVSHNMAVIQRLCRFGLMLDRGNLKAIGPIEEVVREYLSSASPEIASFDSSNRSGSGWARIAGASVVDEHGMPLRSRPADRDLIFRIHVSMSEAEGGASLKGLVLELMFYTEAGDPITSVMNVDQGNPALPESSDCTVEMRLPAPTFVPGKYRIRIFLGIPYFQHVDDVIDALTFEIAPPERPWRPYDLYSIRGSSCRLAEWEYLTSELLAAGAGHGNSGSVAVQRNDASIFR